MSYDINISDNDTDTVEDQHDEKKAAETTKWNLVKYLITSKKKSENISNNGKGNNDKVCQNNLENKHQGGWVHLVNRIRRKPKPPDIEQGLGNEV